MGLTQQRGNAAEAEALKFLQKKGYRLLEKNWRAHTGEIDLIMLHAQVLVFVEVRARGGNRAGSALESVVGKKSRRLLNTARLYLLKHPAHQQRACRVDVVAFDGEGNAPVLTVNAISLD